MAEQMITKDALSIIFNDPENALTTLPMPVLQCLQIKQLPPQPPSPDRYRMIVSDGRFFCYGMLATQSNHITLNNGVPSNSLVRLKSYQANAVRGKHVLIILDMELVEDYGVPPKLGEPVFLELDNLNAGGGAAAAAAPQQPATISGQNFYGSNNNNNNNSNSNAATNQDTKPKLESMSGAPGGNTINRRPAPGGGGGGGGGGTYNNTNIYPIEGVSPYAAKWTIKARVVSKSDVRHWQKPSGEGKLFNVNLMDESGEIKMTAFNNEVDKYYDVLQEGAVYYISTPCKVSFAKKQFTNLPHDFELTMERDTVVEKAEDQASVPQVRYNFVTLQDLQTVEKDATVDVICVLKEVSDVAEIRSKTTNKPFEKRELQLVDDSGFTVRLTVWGKTAIGFDVPVDSVVAFKGAQVGDFGGRSLSLLRSGSMSVNPDINEAHRLKGWYDSVGRSDSFATHQGLGASGLGAAGGRRDVLKTIAQVKEENLGTEGDEYFSVKATIVYIKADNFAYPACRSEQCSKKMTETTDGTWRCDKCNSVYDRPQYRYIMSINVADHTGQMWLSCFDDSGRAIMGKSADEVTELLFDDQAKTAAFERGVCRTMVFRVRAKMDTYGETQRVRYQVMSASPVNFVQEAARLTELIKQYDINS